MYQDPEPEFQKIPCQGDIFQKEIIRVDFVNTETIAGWMIINTACDLAQKKLDFFCFVPIRRLRYYTEKNKDLGKKKLRANLSNIIKYITNKTFFLPATSKFNKDNDHYCELQYIFSVEVRGNFAQKCEEMIPFRITALKPPWREKLGNLVGNNFSRVGIPDPKKGWEKMREQIISQSL